MSAAPGSFRARLGDLEREPLVVPGVGTALEARCAVAAGFDVVYQSGYATAAWRHGQPDIGLVALEETAAALEAVAEAVDAAVICDADTGYGDLPNVARTVRRLERMGASAIQLEDQAWPKRCGHMDGKRVVPAGEHELKIKAAVLARQDPDTVIVARTDALAVHGLDDALERVRRYGDAGADALFVDAPTSVADLEAIAAALPDRLLFANMSESGLTPHLSARDFHELGFAVVLFPTSALRIAARTITDFFTELHSTGDSRTWVEQMTSLDELNEIVGLPAVVAAQEAAGG